MNGLEFQSYSLEFILLATSILLITSVLVSRVSSKFGVPVLLLFLGIGMLAGSEGPGGFEFADYSLAFAIGSVCLAIIMFDGGLRTSWKSVRPILPLGTSLSFVGTVVTGVTTGVFAHYVLGLSWLSGFVLGSIVSSTDAAAVFSILRSRNLSLKGKLKQVLEFEAGSNDPVAIFLTMGMLSLAMSPDSGFASIVVLFVKQAGLGFLFGFLGGRAICWLIDHVDIEYEGLYSVLLLALVVFLFAITSTLGGSGFLAVYIAGLILGQAKFIHKGSIERFQDGMAWIAQIIVFLTLGLLVIPSHLLSVWKEGLLLAFFMMIVSRPLSVLFAAPGKFLKLNERVFVSWVGLRGAAPIILATLPWSVGFPNAEYYFNLVFFVVIVSVVVQGMSIPWVARKVGVTAPLREKFTAESIIGLLPPGFVTVDIEVTEGSRAANKRIIDLSLPSGVLLTNIERNERFLIPTGSTTVEPGDKISGLARPSSIESLSKVFGKATPSR